MLLVHLVGVVGVAGGRGAAEEEVPEAGVQEAEVVSAQGQILKNKMMKKRKCLLNWISRTIKISEIGWNILRITPTIL